MLRNANDLHVVAVGKLTPKNQAELLAMLPEFTPLRGAKTADKIAEQRAEHMAGWVASACERPQTCVLSDLCLLLVTGDSEDYFGFSLHGKGESQVADVVTEFATIATQYVRPRDGNTNYGNVYWYGENTHLLAKVMMFMLAPENAFSAIDTSDDQVGYAYPGLVYGAKHFSLTGLLECDTKLSVSVQQAMELFLPAERIDAVEKAVTKYDTETSKVLRDALYTYHCFATIGSIGPTSFLVPPKQVVCKS